MARLLRNDHTGPYRIDPADFPKDGKAIFICACGLSSKMPYCDGTHKTCCRSEEPGMLYIYDPQTKQIVERRPETRESEPRA